MLVLPSTLLFLLSLPFAAWSTNTDTCDPSRNGLTSGSLQYRSDCNATTWCNNGVCEPKRCRKDEFPLGWPKNITLADKCDKGTFCPDEGSSCQALLPVGSPCQFDRDDECQAPDNFQDLRDTSGRGLNVNGSICLNFVCQWANVTVGQQCIIENTGYVAYAPGGNEFGFVVSRDNCKIGLYCDAQSQVCIQQKDIGASCDADKECSTFNCEPNNVCGVAVEDPRDVKTWVYIVVGVGIFGGMFATMVLFFFLHGRARDVEREKRLQYWREQNAFRQNIMQMRETARASIFSATNSQRGTMYSRDGAASEDSHAPMLQNAAAHAAMKGSGLRYYVSDDGTYEQEPEEFEDDKKY